MSRHRNIRSMNYSEEYDGYDDVYGHSVEEDYCMSPSQATFMYNRDNPQKISAFMATQNDIVEEDEDDELAKAKLESCIEAMKDTFGTTLTRQQMVDSAIKHNYNHEKAIQEVLDNQGEPTTTVSQEKKVQLETEPPTTPSIKVVTPAATPTTTSKARSVIKGFDVSNKLSTPRSQSPASGRGTPTHTAANDGDRTLEEIRTPSKKEKTIDAEAAYKKERGDLKEHLYMIVIGHVDAGKSTLMGHLLCALGQIQQKTMHKYEQESRKLGKQSFMYAWVLDETGEERNRGITMDVGRSQFETKSKLVTLLDAPGHKDFIPNMISGAGQADVALLVVDATRGEFETGFEFGGQTREHALLVRSLGVTQLAVAINKLDTVSWLEDRFNEIREKLKAFLKQAGFRDSDVTYVPCSGLTGQNLVTKSTENELVSWYNGPSLLEVIDNFRSPDRPITKPFRFSINDIFKGTGSNFCVAGRVETGCLSVGDKVMICPSREVAVVKNMATEEMPQQVVFAGDQPSITLTGVEMQNVTVGNILCEPQFPVPVATKFQCRIVVFNVTIPITKGFPVVLHHQSLVEPATISKLISQLNKATGEILKKHPRFLGNNTSAMIEIQVQRPLAIELYSDCKELGRVMLRVGGVTIAAGLITKIIL